MNNAKSRECAGGRGRHQPVFSLCGCLDTNEIRYEGWEKNVLEKLRFSQVPQLPAAKCCTVIKNKQKIKFMILWAP